MLPLIPLLVLSFASFSASVFVILRIVIPILPPHPLSKRVSPAEFGLPPFRSLTPADKSHIWLASLDFLALGVLIWQAVFETTGGPSGHAAAADPGSSSRLWLVMTIRQTCLLFIAVITLLHVRMGRSVTFGTKHWMLWSPTLVVIVVSTALAGVISGIGVTTLFAGIVGYTASVAILTTIAFGCLIGTLFNIKKNLKTLNEKNDPWPSAQQCEEKPRPSFGTEDIDAIRDGASWITSTASHGSRRNSASAWSFTTHHTAGTASQQIHGARQPYSSVPAKSSFWFGHSTNHNGPAIPPVPPLPSPYGPLSPTSETLRDPDPFRRDPSPLPDPPNFPRERFGSQTSWLTSSAGSQTTVSAWSYPTSYHASIHNGSQISLNDTNTPLNGGDTRPHTPAMSDAKVLGGYGFAPGNVQVEQGLVELAVPSGTNMKITTHPIIGWSIMIWLPLGLSLPYLITVLQNQTASMISEILFILSVTLSSPLLALNILLRSPLPIPVGLFDTRGGFPADMNRSHSPTDTLIPFSHRYKPSMSTSVTVVEGRRSGDVWITKGDAVDGKSKFGRAVGMLAPKPKLSVLPPEENDEIMSSPPLPMQEGDFSLPININGTPSSETSAQFGRMRKESKASSHFSSADDNLAVTSRIMVAQRHYSALAQTISVSKSSMHSRSPTPTGESFASSVDVTGPTRHSAHLRSRSTSSMNDPGTPSSREFNISPPPGFPLPPTPPNVRAARLAELAHKKSFSSGFSFGSVDNVNEIDALTAGLLPLLIPGLKVGQNMKVVEGEWTPLKTSNEQQGKAAQKKFQEFGEDITSPQIYSTPAKGHSRTRKKSNHKRNHFSLPSLGLGKDGAHTFGTWSAEIKKAFENNYIAVPKAPESGWRHSVFGADSVPNANPLQSVQESDEALADTRPGVCRSKSTRVLGLRAEVPHSVDTSPVSRFISNPLDGISPASTVTLFEDFEAGLKVPHAESTPHNTVNSRSPRQAAPPIPTNRRSSIMYIKSSDTSRPASSPNSDLEPSFEPVPSAVTSLARWGSRAVRLMPKSSKALHKAISPSEDGLRPLSLLKDRDTNINMNTLESPKQPSGIRPLTLAKKQRNARAGNKVSDENASPVGIKAQSGDANARGKNIKRLQLARSETSKIRGVLRQTEVLPQFVVRPPSGADTEGNVSYA